MASLDTEIMKYRVSCVWEEGGEGGGRELIVWLVKFVWVKACVEARLLDHTDHPGQQKCKPKKKGQLW